MKFKFEEIVTFRAPVAVTTPNGDQSTFTGIFRYLDDAAAGETAPLTNVELLRQVWAGWDGIVGPDDKPLPFGEAQRDLLLGHTYIHNAVAVAYVQARAGMRAKN